MVHCCDFCMQVYTHGRLYALYMYMYMQYCALIYYTSYVCTC